MTKSNNGGSRRAGWAAVGNRAGAQEAFNKWLNSTEGTLTMRELVLARDYAAFVEDDQDLTRKINSDIGREMRKVCGVD